MRRLLGLLLGVVSVLALVALGYANNSTAVFGLLLLSGAALIAFWNLLGEKPWI